MYEQVLKSIAQQVTGVIHFGAHVGEEAKLYADCGIKRVAWVEPNLALHDRLLEAVKPCGGIVIPVAVGGLAPIKDHLYVASNDGGSSSLHRFAEHKKFYPQIRMERTVEVEVWPIQKIIDEYELYDCNLWYFDIQGHEYQALQYSKAIQWAADFIYAEVQFEKLYEGTELVSAVDGCLDDFTCRAIYDTGCGWGEALYVRQRIGAHGAHQRAIHGREL